MRLAIPSHLGDRSDRNLLSLAFSPDGKRLAICQKKLVTIWDPEMGLMILTLDNLPGEISQVAFHPGNKNLALAHGTGGSLGTRHAAATVIMERE